MVEVAGNRLVWRHIQKEKSLTECIPPIPQGLNEEDRKMMLDPLGYDAIKDIDEIFSRNRRKSDDPYIRATMENADYKKWKNNTAERR